MRQSWGDRARKYGIAVLAPRCCVLGHDPCGGSEIVLWEHVRILRRAGLDVRVYARHGRLGTPLTLLGTRTNARLLTSLEYCGQFVARERRSLLVAHNEPTVALLAPGRSIVRFGWTTPLPKYWRTPGIVETFRRACYLFPSYSERNLFLRQHDAIPRDSTAVIPNAVDLTQFRPTNSRESGPVRVGFAGQWSAGKGLDVLLNAWQSLGEPGAAELWIAGGPNLWKNDRPAPNSDRFRERVASAEARGNVRVVGEISREEMPGFWNAVDAAVVPSLEEAFGIVAVEAMACGAPVIASAVGGLAETVVDGTSGLVVSPGRPEELANTIRRLIEDEPLRQRLSEGARRRAAQYGLERLSERLLGLVESKGTRRCDGDDAWTTPNSAETGTEQTIRVD